MGLLGGIARVAAATAVSNRVSRRQAQRWAAQGSAYSPVPQAAPPPATGEPASGPIEQLKDLADLKQQGILTEAEFAEQKQRILAG